MSYPGNAQKCVVDGCSRDEELVRGRPAGGMCAGHRYRKRKGLPLEPPIHEGLARNMPPRRALIEAGLALADVPTDGDGDALMRRAEERLCYAAIAYSATRKKGMR